MTGPVQVLVVGFEEPAFSGEVLAELTRLRQAGIVRLIDLLLVSRSSDGTFETLDLPPELNAGYGQIAAAILGGPDREPESEAEMSVGAHTGTAHEWSVASAVPPGSSAAIALIEHTWAGPLVAAIKAAGGTPCEETWLAPADVEKLEALLSSSDRR